MNISHNSYRLLSSLSPGNVSVYASHTRRLQISFGLFKNSVSVDRAKTQGSLTSQAQTFVPATIPCRTSLSTPTAVSNLQPTRWQSFRKRALHELKHYYTGSKLLCIETKLAGGLLRRVFRGHALTRRERKQLLRTTGDLCRLVPFSVFVIVPFMEFTLPIFLKVFPNMLPSTFKQIDRLEEKSRKRLPIQLQAATILEQTMLNMQGNRVHPSADDLIEYAPIISTNFAIDNLARSELIALCKFLHISSFGPNGYLRAKLQLKFHRLHADDRYLASEGIDTLTLEELQAACYDRGMSLVGVSTECLQAQLQQWIDLHCNRGVAAIVLLLSHACRLLNSNSSFGESHSQLVESSAMKKTDAVHQETVRYLPHISKYDMKDCLSIKQFERSANIQLLGMPSRHPFHLHQSLPMSCKRQRMH